MDENILSRVGRHWDVFKALGDGEPSTTLEAQAVLEHIRAEKGYLDEETLQELNTISDRGRQTILRIVDSKQDTEAAYTKSISEQLYSSKYRFLYELIQNADDSLYSNATRKKSPPFLRFKVTPTTFIVETNEDGFTRANIEAICATGKSSKKASALDDHIGEKGFGFKSVFSIAEEVHIQSGVWSFKFIHQQGDDGLGMVTPLEAQAESLPSDVKTRMTLTLSEASRGEYQRLLDAIADMPDTTIFFLQRLHKFEIHLTRSDSLWSKTVINKTRSIFLSSIEIFRSSKEPDKDVKIEAVEKIHFYVFSHIITSMPKDVQRKNRNSAKVQLAFPVHMFPQSPKLSELGQHAFAYLPLHRISQIQFLIQSDFITSASRENITDCAWNDAIREGVAKTFTQAIATFATSSHPLRYSWLDYLPTKPMDGFWKNFLRSIKALLQYMPVLQTWERRQFKRPSQLHRLPNFCLDAEKPIFRDLQEEIYLAPEYKPEHEKALTDLGVVKSIYWTQVVQRIEADVVRIDSYFRTLPQSHKWHVSSSNVLRKVFSSSNDENLCRRVKRLAIIPINGGMSWSGAPGISLGGASKIYFPSIDDIDIPQDISLHLVETIAASNATRRLFFREMGVEDCPKETVISRIEATHRSLNVGTLAWKPHFRFLFHFHSSPESLRPWLRVDTSTGLMQISPSMPLYFPSDNEYDTEQLFPKGFFNEWNGVAALLSKEMVDLISPLVRQQNLTWVDWLVHATGARYHPPLRQGESLQSEPSKVLLAVLKHSPHKFVGLLRAHWAEYKAYSAFVKYKLKECAVPRESGTPLPLEKMYLPTPYIKSKLRELEAEKEFPLLKLPSPLSEADQRDWHFLEEFGVRCTIDLRFYGIILTNMISSQGVTKKRVTEVYSGMASLATISSGLMLRNFFKSRNSIAIFGSQNTLRWIKPSECLWDGPDFFTSKVPLKQHYGDQANLSSLFSSILEIPDTKYDDILDELDHRRNGSQNKTWTFIETTKVYQYLETTVRIDAEWASIREAFSERKLVMTFDSQWCTLQSCLWNSPFTLSEYSDLSIAYPTLKTFFVNHLKVKKASPSILVNELRRMAQERNPRIKDIRQRFLDVGRMVAKSGIDQNLANALDKLKEAQFLPMKIKQDESALVGLDDNFAIFDHDRFGRAFINHSILLDFAIDEVQILDTLFQHWGLNQRYLSVVVEEVSTVGEDLARNEVLERKLQRKAYAMYCCAAKYKSVKALRGETELFQQLSHAQVYTTDNISTYLVLTLSKRELRVQSDRLALHSEISDQQLKIYVPDAKQPRNACYRSQLPKFLANFLGVNLNAAFDISEILRCEINDLDDILLERDIPHVDWIEKPALEEPVIEESAIVEPAIELPDISNDRTSSTLQDIPHVMDDSSPVAIATPSRPSANHIIPNSTPHQIQSVNRASFSGDERPTTPTRPRQYERLVEQVVQSAQRISYGAQRPDPNTARIRDAPPRNIFPAPDFDHVETFGDRDRNEMEHDRKIGAAGEAYVFETLSNLSLSHFSRENWRSTIRGELRAHSRYASMANWNGRETADIVYTDRDGGLTKYLRENCHGGFPDRISPDRVFETEPIEYFLEVKTTTSSCSTRFFMSGSQYKRMENLAVDANRIVKQIYVIFRVFDLTSESRGMRIFVDPHRLSGSHIDFEVGTWVGKAKESI